MGKSKRIVFFHPDLGIGGAERLIIDAAVGLQSLGHEVTIFTSHRDRAHCFDEARDGTLDVRVRGDSLFPATLFGRFKILCAVLRQYHLLMSIAVRGELRNLQPTAFFVDQLSAGMPLLRYLFPETRILFYCHFPDLLLARRDGSWLQGFVKRIWRVPFDALEGWSMRGADRVVVNSGFTKKVLESVWGTRIGGEKGVGVVYPCVNTKDEQSRQKNARQDASMWEGKKVILSINRFERKKDIGKAIRAFAGLEEEERKHARLVIAGGYDRREAENVQYHRELIDIAEDRGLKSATLKNIVTALSVPNDVDVIFLLSVTSQVKNMLLSAATLLVYTPINEHFGIVPLEAMLAGVPVLAAASGGPLETVLDGKTGWLRSSEPLSAWTMVMREALFELSDDQRKEMAKAARSRVEDHFSEAQMARTLDGEIEDMIKSGRASMMELQDIFLAFGVLGLLVMSMGMAIRWMT